MVRIVIQARLASCRLPGKAILPIGGMPAAVLAALRAANLGMEVLAAISTAKSDNLLATTLERNGIQVFRGPLDDVLHRFVLATEDLPGRGTVVRLTADNVFPDGDFIGHLLAAYQRTGGQYLDSASVFEMLPCGVAAEAFSVSALREADRRADSASDRAHVTPWLIRHFSEPRAEPARSSPLRATIDSMDDYERISQVFEEISDPVTVPWRNLCSRLSSAAGTQVPARFIAGEWASELVLGTAQLGLPDYGRANSTGLPAHHSAVELVREAVALGVDGFDTARAYGSAEHVLGDGLRPFGGRIRVATKLDPLAELSQNATNHEVRCAVDASVFRSCRELGLNSIPMLLLHRWLHRTCNRGSIWERLIELRSEGVIGRLGVSVTSPAEASEALQDPDVQAVQLPFNILDPRWQAAGVDRLATERGDVVVHVRSVFLQGILAAAPHVWPPVSGVHPGHILAQLDGLSQQLGRVDRADLCLAFVRAQPWVHHIVIGVETIHQLRDLFQRFQCPALSVSEADSLRKTFPSMPEALLNPALWPRK